MQMAITIFITLTMVRATMSTDEVLPMGLKCQGIPALSAELIDSEMYTTAMMVEGREKSDVNSSLMVFSCLSLRFIYLHHYIKIQQLTG